MPEVEQAAPAASSISEPSSIGGGDGALNLSDEDILGIDPEGVTSSPAPAEAPAATEAPAPAETPADAKPPETTAPPPEPVDDLKWMRPLLNDKVFGPKLQSMHDKLLAYQELHPTVADLRAVKELVPGGVEELKSLVAKSKEVDEMDLQYFSHDQDTQRDFMQNLYRDDPEAFTSGLQVGLDLIKAQSPQEWAYLTQHYVGESLQSEKVWDWLEYIHESAVKAGATDVAQLLNQFAGTFQKYGLGPREQQDPNLQRVNAARSEVELKYQRLEAERQQDFRAETDRNVTSVLDNAIGSELTRLLPKTSEGLRSKIARDVHSEIQKAIGGDAGLKLRLANLMRTGGINRQTQEQVSNLLVSKAKLVMPGAVKRVVNEYTASIMSARKEVDSKQTAAASRVDVSGGSRPRTGPRPLTREEAKGMSFEDILGSDRPAER
jgi:hypothetical protein